MSRLFLVSIAFLLWSCKDEAINKTTISGPNIIYILADDLGYGELGSYGQKIIETPHLDELADGGMLFSRHYTGAPVCAPARCIFLTGQHSGKAHIRGNDEWADRGAVWSMEAMLQDSSLEGQRPVPDSIIMISELLKAEGYATGMVGKWGLGAPNTNSVPNKRGFDYFLGYNCQRQAHTYYPTHLWENEKRRLLDNRLVPMHANLDENANPNDPESYADFQLNDYSPDVMHEGAKQFIRNNSKQPFFLYYASPLPHVPLQAPQKWVDYYRNKVGEEQPYTGKSYFPCQYPLATYAAMISTLDEQVGELVTLLKELGLYENTLIFFSSDNGPTYTGGTDTEYFDSAAPFRTTFGFGKGFVKEGGIRVPFIAHWPGVISPGSKSNHRSAFQDLMPTICDIAGIPVPSQADGISFAPLLTGKGQQEKHEFLYWEFPENKGQQAVIKDQWKAVRLNIKDGNMDIALYNLNVDSLELNDVASEHPEIVRMMEKIMKENHHRASIEKFQMAPLGD